MTRLPVRSISSRRFSCLIAVVAFAAALPFAQARVACAEENDWSRQYGGTSADHPAQVAVDADGNIFVTGVIAGAVNFGGGVLDTGGSDDIFVAKFDRWGYHLWSTRFGTAGNDAGLCVAVDDSGNVVVGGYFLGAVDFGGGTLTSAGLNDMFLVKLDPSGHHVWSRRFGGANNDEVDDVTIDALGRVVATGSFRDAVDFGGGPMGSAGASDGFVAVFDPSGNHVWSRTFGAGLADEGRGVAADPFGNVFVTGAFQDTVSFGGGSFASAGLNDVFVVKYDSTGAHRWSARYGDTNFQSGDRVAANADGDVVVAGSFFGTVDFGGGPFTSAGLWDTFVAAYDSAGAALWSRAFGGSFDDHPYAVAIHPSGDVFVTGAFGGTVDFGGGDLTSAGGSDGFLVHYDPANNHVWSARFGDTDSDAGCGVAVSGTDHVVFTGSFRDTVDVGGGPLAGEGVDDIFLAQLWLVTPTAAGTPVPTALDLRVYPNPFNPATTVAYTVPRAGPVSVAVYDVAGRLVDTLLGDEYQLPGAHALGFQPRGLASGVYFVRVRSGGLVETRRITLLK